MVFIKQAKTNLKYILILAVVAIIVIVILVIVETNSGVRSRSKAARAIADMSQLRSMAEVMYGNENGYMNVNCNYGDVKIFCDDIEEMVDMKPILYSSTNKYCAYVKLSGEKEFRGEYYGDYWCVDSSLTSRGIKYIDPGVSGYCTGTTFRCPNRDGTPSFNQIIGVIIDELKELLPTILGWVGLISGCAILFWDYLRRKRGKKRLFFLGVIGITLLIASILWFLIVVSLSGAR